MIGRVMIYAMELPQNDTQAILLGLLTLWLVFFVYLAIMKSVKALWSRRIALGSIVAFSVMTIRVIVLGLFAILVVPSLAGIVVRVHLIAMFETRPYSSKGYFIKSFPYVNSIC